MAPSQPPFIANEKASWRAWARNHREQLEPAARAAAAMAAATRLDQEILRRLPSGSSVGLYAAIRGEMTADRVAEMATRRGLVVAYPRVSPGDRVLRFHQARPTDLHAGVFGIPEPSSELPSCALDDLAVIVVPALLFDRAGRRLGWGGGFYDATLPATPAIRVGLAYELQLVDQLPFDHHDQPVHLIATDMALHPGAPGPHPWTS